jgi:hypothetical protein
MRPCDVCVWPITLLAAMQRYFRNWSKADFARSVAKCAPQPRQTSPFDVGLRSSSGSLAKFAAMRRASGHVDTAIHTDGLTSDVGVLHERKHYAGNLGGGAEATYWNALRARL